MKINAEGLALIKKFEGLRLKAYRCSAGKLTIGYGCTQGVTEDMCITEAQAEEMLREHLGPLERQITEILRVAVTENEFSALVCFAYNVGFGALKSSKLLAALNRGLRDFAAMQFVAWDHVNGKVVPGLLRRRVEEQALFESGTAREEIKA